jgi:hypothetical protein
MRTAQTFDGLFPTMLKFLELFSLCTGQTLEAGLVLGYDLINKTLFSTFEPYSPEEEKTNNHPQQPQQNEKPHPPGPTHTQNQPEDQKDGQASQGNKE